MHLYEILPEEVSDEAAAHLAEIFRELALAIEEHYYAQIHRHNKTIASEFERPPEESF